MLSVELVSPVLEQWPDHFSASGEIAPWQEAVIGTEIAGVRLKEVLVDVGDVVKGGQLLARYDEATLRAELATLDAAVAEARAQLLRAQANAVRADRLKAVEALSGQVVQDYQTQASVAQAQLDSANARREAQLLKLRYARVTAPDDGVITSRSATLGAVGMLGGELFRLLRGGRLEWRAEVSSTALTRLQAGMPVEILHTDGRVVVGRLRQVSPTVDARTRNGLAYVDVPPDSGLSAGMYVSGKFFAAEREALTVPESAIVLRDGNRYLMQVGADRRVRQVKVASGRRRNGAIEILEGIGADDRFVLSGGAFLADGDLVELAKDGAASTKKDQPRS